MVDVGNKITVGDHTIGVLDINGDGIKTSFSVQNGLTNAWNL